MVMLRTTNDNSANLARGPARRIRTSIQSQPGALRRIGVLAVTLACCVLVAAAWERSEHRPRRIGHPEGEKAIAERVVSSQDAIDNFQQFAFNALVLPLIDDTVPPRWTLQGMHWICDGRGKVTVDGKPVTEGALVPAGPFNVRWDLHRCPPLSGAELLADGELEFHVTPNGSDLSGHVAAASMSLDTPAGRFQLPSAAHDRFAAGKAADAAR